MTTLDDASIGQILTFKIGRAITARKEAKARQAVHAPTWFISTVRLILHLAGFGCLTYAGFEWSTIAGLVVAGVSFFVMSSLTTSRTAQQSQSTVDPMANRR